MTIEPFAGVASLAELQAKLESADQRLLAMNSELREQRLSATDDEQIVEITVTTGGAIVGAAVNPDSMPTLTADRLCAAILGAAGNAQRAAQQFGAERVSYYFGEDHTTGGNP